MSNKEVLQNIINELNCLKSYCESQMGHKIDNDMSKAGGMLTVKEIADKYLFCSEGAVYDLLRKGKVNVTNKGGKFCANENDVLRQFILNKGKRSFFSMRRHYNQRPEFKQKMDEVLLESGLGNPF